MASLLLFIIFLMLSLLHFYWSLGGLWGFENSLLTKETGKRVLNPTKFDSAIVGIELAAFASFYLFSSGLINNYLPTWLTNYGGWIIPSVFIIRAIGDFKYVGFFKKVRQTNFGKKDTLFYSPLCMGIGLIGIVIKLI